MLKLISKYVDIVVRWVAISSADPAKASASIKFALLFIVPWAIKASAVACGLGLACLTFLDAAWFDQVIMFIANGAYYLFGLIAVVGTAWAFFRKVSNTVKGTNAAFG